MILKSLNPKEIIEMNSIIDKTKWYRQAVEGKVILTGTPSLGVIMDLSYPTFFYMKKEYGNYLNVEMMNKESRAFIELCRTSTKPIDNYFKKFRENADKLIHLCKEAEDIDFNLISMEELRKFTKELDDLYLALWSEAFLCDKFDPEGDNYFKNELKKHNLNLDHEQITILVRPQKLNFVELSNLELCKIAKKFKDHDPSDDELLNVLGSFVKKFYFIQNSWGNVVLLTSKHFIEPLKEILALSIERIDEMISGYEHLEENTKKKAQELIEKLDLNEELQNVIYLYRKLALLRDERKEVVLRTNYYCELIARRFANEYNVELKYTQNAFTFELAEIKNKEEMDALIPNIEQRLVSMVIGNFDKTTKDNDKNKKQPFIIDGNEATTIINKFHSKLVEKFNSIKGMVACNGEGNDNIVIDDNDNPIVNGEIKIILGETHFTKFNEGDILVTAMTRPEFLPLMKKAKAVITDEGGLTCHASIVSRELNIPCIIGTHIATKKLFDNKEVVMDMKTGVIKLIE
jgi:phosphohistidine swiveling domain-containing protein